MKKNKLLADYAYDFGLLGISSVIKPHKLAWHLNGQLNFKLIKKQDHQVNNKQNTPCLYVNYLHETLLTTIRIFKNKPNEPASPKWALVAEHAHCDYIIMYKSDDDKLGNRLHGALKNIVSVDWVGFLPLASLKSKENFIF
jgi:hypothetical protein